MRRTGVDKVRENLRLQQVYNVFLRYGGDFAFSRWGLLGDIRHRLQVLGVGSARRLRSSQHAR